MTFGIARIKQILLYSSEEDFISYAREIRHISERSDLPINKQIAFKNLIKWCENRYKIHHF